MKEPIDEWAPLPEKAAVPSGWRPLKYALIGAVLAVAVAVLLSAVWGFIFGLNSAFYGSHKPGWDGAAIRAMIMFFFGGFPIAGIGFVIGLVVGLVKSDPERG